MAVTLPKNFSEVKRHLQEPLIRNSFFIMASSLAAAGFGFFLGGLYGFCHTLNRSAAFSPSAGLKRILLCVFVMLAGGYLIAASFYTQGSPRCTDYEDEQKARKNAEECF